MKNHFAAIAYFALAVLCVHVGGHYTTSPSPIPFLLHAAALVAAVVGLTFFISGSVVYARSGFGTLLKLVRDARREPMRPLSNARIGD
ncbi:MAG: hypothetical protein KDA72_02050 [Planctomycetales bacterium]|nr:hypothetical protein [Planctomycetales bacterium]